MENLIGQNEINDAAKKASIDNVTQYSPSSYSAGFRDGVKFALETLKKKGVVK